MLSSSFVLFCQFSKEINYENLLQKFLAIVHLEVGGPYIRELKNHDDDFVDDDRK